MRRISREDFHLQLVELCSRIMSLTIALFVTSAVGSLLALLMFSWFTFGKRLRRVQQLGKAFPGPKPLPLIGNANLFMGLQPEQVCQVIGDLAAEYGDTYTLWLGQTLSVMMFNPRDAEQVLSSTQLLDKSLEYGFLMRWLNEGLLVSRGRKWHQRRKIITPAFHFRILEPYVEIFDRQTRQLVRQLRQACNGDPIELAHATHMCALDIICGKLQEGSQCSNKRISLQAH